MAKTSPFEEGRPDSPLIVLGQAPGKMEMRAKQPLVGPSGDVFKECLHMAGMTRREVYILNVWEDFVTTDAKGDIWLNDIRLWSKSGFTEHGLELAQNTLTRIQKSGATTILTLGQQALELCSGISNRVLKWRGSPLTGLDRIGNKFVIPTLHPAATLHGTYLWRYLIISDMKKAVRQTKTPISLNPQMTFHLRPKLKDILEYIRHCKDLKKVASDLEVINQQVSCFCLCPSEREGMVVAFMDEQGEMWTEDEEIQIWQAYADLMYDAEVMKVNQNLVGFDAPFLMRQNRIYVRGPIGDPMIAQARLYPEFNKGIDFQASIHTDHVYWKDEGKMWKNVGSSGAADYTTFWKYNGKDGCVALELWRLLGEEMTERGMWPTYNRSADMLPALMMMTMDGLTVDDQALAETHKDITAQIELREAELLACADYDFNPKSPAQCKKYFYDHKKLPPYLNGQGKPTTDDKAMSRIFRKTHLPEAKLVQDIRGLHKLRGTYLEVERDPDGRLRSTWNPVGTWTGRLSSSKTIFDRGMNLQNLDPRFKGFIVEDVE
jgi:uracil-DNA glycosylase